ncbi:MAG: tetratricopeptide repeat protein [Limisphaerales bacterium]
MLLPFLFLVVLELCLRLFGYGYDPAFFKTERDASGKKFLINNDTFTFRFFPPELARWPVAFKLAAEKPPDVKRIFIFGESAAMGDPQPSVGASHYLEILLCEKIPQQKFEVVNLGITAINSHVILPIACEVAARGQGDLWLIYMGNNEMVGPFGAATVFGAQAAPLRMARLNLAIQKTRVGQLATSLMRHLGGKSKNAAWGGMTMFLQNQIPPEDPRRETVYQNFTQNLRDILQSAQTCGAKVVLSTVSVNLRDCPPFGSLVNREFPTGEKTKFEALYAEAVSLQTNQHPAAAAQVFAQAAQLDPGFAELQFRWAQCLLGETNLAAAREHFQKACDVDALPFRADSRINGAIRSMATESAGTNLMFCDAERALAAATPGGIAGDESFFEHVHFNFDGNYLLARAWAEQIAQLLPDDVRRKATTGWATQDVCERAIGLSNWNRMLVIASVLSRMRQPPLAAQFNNPARAQVLLRELGELKLQTNAVAQARADFAAIVARRPGDNSLHENYANFLKSIGDKPEALAEYLKITEQLPHDFYAILQAGRLLGELGQLQKAENLLRRAAAQRPAQPDAWFELGVVLAAGAHYEAALEMFDRVAKLHPSDAACLTHQARVLSKLNHHGEAIKKYRELVQLNSGSWAAHLELAVELSVTDQVEESIQEYQEAARLNPRHPVIHVNLGVLLTRQNHLDEAIQQFDIALHLDPNNTAASEYLHQVTMRRNQNRH